MRTLKISFLVFILSITASSQNFWQQTTGPFGGNIYSMEISSNGNIFIGTSRAGIYKTSNNGDLWYSINQGIEYTNGEYINSICTDTNITMYIATRYYQVYKSTNLGEDWVRTNNGLPDASALQVIVNKVGYVFTNIFYNGIYRSTNYGESWIQTVNGIGNYLVTDLAVNTEDQLYASTESGGIFLSSDNGDTWTSINNGLPILDCININVVEDELIFTRLGDNSLYRSTNGGVSWHLVGGGLENLFSTKIKKHPNGDLYAGIFEGGVYKSSDLGVSWTPVNTGIEHTVTRTIELDNTSNIYIGTFGEGVLKSENSGSSWHQENYGLLNSYIRDFAFTKEGALYTATSGGVFRTSLYGNEWEAVLNGLDDREVRAIASNSLGKVFAGTWNEGLYILDENDSWIQSSDLEGKSIRSIAINENDWVYAGTYGAGGVGIYRSTNDGVSWTQINSDLHTLEIHSMENGLMFAGGWSQVHSGLFKSTDYGDNWEFCAFELYEITGITSDSSQNVFVITGSPEGVFMSTDCGATWSSIGLEGSAKHSIAPSKEGYIYVGTEWGVYRSNNFGNDWEPLIDGMTNFYASALICIPGNKVFVGTLGGGVCIGRDSTTSLESDKNQIPKNYYLYHNYPNPFNPSTVISYQLPVNGNVTLKVYDVLGNEVATLVNEEKPAGTYEIMWNAANLPSGVYFYQLKAGEFVETRKMVLLR